MGVELDVVDGWRHGEERPHPLTPSIPLRVPVISGAVVEDGQAQAVDQGQAVVAAADALSPPFIFEQPGVLQLRDGSWLAVLKEGDWDGARVISVLLRQDIDGARLVQKAEGVAVGPLPALFAAVHGS